MTTNQDGPSADDFAMKVWREALEEFDPVWGGTDKHEAAAARVLSEAFDEVRAEERARIVAWARDEDAKRPRDNWFAHIAQLIEQGAHDNGHG